MARIDLKEENLLPSQDLKPKPKPPKKERRAKKRSVKTSCLRLAGFLFIFILIILVALIAKAGIIEIPVLSQIFYRVPSPSRLIVIDNPEDFIRRPASYQYDQTTKMTTMELTEEELTFIIRQNLAKQEKPKFAQNTQIVINEGEIEFFGLMLRPIKVNLTLKVKISKPEGAPYSYQITQFKVGNLNLPPSLVNWSVHKYLEKSGDKHTTLYNIDLNQVNSDKSRTPALELKDGKLILRLAIDIGLIRDSVTSLIKVIDQLDNVEKEKISNYDFDNLAPDTIEKLKSIGLDVEQLKKLKELKSK
ncbi:MAG: hypothetical protein WC675_02360 [Patescibacteria group bacterium]|jgi:hypothetical protein